MPRRVQFTSGDTLAEQIQALRSIDHSNDVLRDAYVRDQGGMTARSRLFEEAAGPMYRPIVAHLAPAPAQVGIPAPPPPPPPVHGPPPLRRPAHPVPAPPAAPPAQGPAAPPAQGPAQPPHAAPADDEDVFDEVIRLARIPRGMADTTILSLRLQDDGAGNGVLTLNGRRISGTLNPLTIDNVPVDAGMATLLVGGRLGQWPANFGAQVPRATIVAYKDILSRQGVPANFGNSAKGASLRFMQGRGRGRTRAAASEDGVWGKLRLDRVALGGGTLILKNPESGETVFHTPASSGLRHLILSKRVSRAQAGRGVFSKDDLVSWDKIRSMAAVRVRRGNNRRKLMQPGAEAVFIPDVVPDMEARLKALVDMANAGNRSQALVQEGSIIADRLLKKRVISKAEHERVVRKLLASVAPAASAPQ